MRIGHRVRKIGQYDVTRETLWVLNYFIYQLEPMPVLPVTFVDMDGSERSVGIQASFKSLEERKKEASARRKEESENPYKCAKISAALTACKLRTFVVEKRFIDKMMKEAAAKVKAYP